MLILGLDPGLKATGWGVIQTTGSNIKHVANGVVRVPAKDTLASRLAQLYGALQEVVEQFLPDTAAVEEVFVNRNPNTTLILGQARGIAILVPAQRGIPVDEYSATRIKKAVVGVGHADKVQMRLMVNHLLPACKIDSHDAVDALAVAICHSHYQTTNSIWLQKHS